MKTTKGFGLVALFALIACSSETVVQRSEGASDPEAGDDTATSTDPNEPSSGGDSTDPEAPPAPLVPGLAVKDVAVYQGVKVLVVKGGAWVSSRNAPVVAGRPALVRVFVTPDASFEAQSVTAELRLVVGARKLPLIKDTKTISRASTDEDTKSTFNFEVPAEQLTKDVTFSVALTAAGGEKVTGESPARFPQDGSQKPIAAETSGKLKIVLVPVKYDADGSGRTPDVSAAQVARYKQTFMARYPTTDVEITVHAPWSWTTPIAGNGSGFSTVLRGITQLRQQERPANDVYYYGALAPASSMNSFCGGGCVTGLSTVVDSASTSYLRASVGIGFAGQDAANTMAHEVGHAHGREHAPCGGAQGVDPDFPYSGGAIGVWGYDIFAKSLIAPTKGRDMMGYCPNEWVSDYTYAALFDRIEALNPTTTKSGSSTSSNAQARTFRIADVAGDGALSFEGHDEIALDVEPSGGIDVQGVKGARFYRFDHLPGGFLVLPKDAVTTSLSKLQVNGMSAVLSGR